MTSPLLFNSSTDSGTNLPVFGDTDSQADSIVYPIDYPGTFEWDDSGNADRLSTRHGNFLCYCRDRGVYHFYDGRRWIKDLLQIERLAEETLAYASRYEAALIKQVKSRNDFDNFIRQSRSKRGLDHAIALARKKVTPVLMEDFDANAWLLNCANGVVNLRNGDLIPHHPRFKCTKLAPVDYYPNAKCEVFLRFLERIMGGGPGMAGEERRCAEELIDCLQMVLGCAVTGNFEKLIVILLGTPRGNNGKTTLIEIVREALGPYSGEILVNTLMARSRESGTDNGNSADIAGLKGARFVTSSEAEEGLRLSAATAKYLTGGNQIKARYLYENPFTFRPTHKLFIDTNHFPVIDNPHDAVWNRVKCIPFSVELSKDEIDTGLKDKLRAELPGILAWIVRGAIWYSNCGLDFPQKVTDLTEKCRHKSDQLADFITELCVVDKSARVPVGNLSDTYQAWARWAGIKPLSPQTFNNRLEQMGCHKERPRPDGKQVRTWFGIGLRPDVQVRRAFSLKPSEAV